MTWGSLASNSEYFGHTIVVLIWFQAYKAFFQNGFFSVWQFPLEKRVIFIGMRVTLSGNLDYS